MRVGLLTMTLLVGGACSSPDLPADGLGTIVEVVDGDTVVVDLAGHRETVRLLGIDTPETVHPDRSVECFGPQASARLRLLLVPGSGVLVTRDVEPRDRYGRLLAYLERLSDGLQVPCNVEELGEAGAYLIRTGDATGHGSIQVGDHVAVQLFQASNNSVESVILDATVVRLEADNGAGLALRFVATEQDEESPYNGVSHDDWMTEVPEIAKLAAKATEHGKGGLLDFRDFTSTTATNDKATSTIPASVVLGRLLRPLLWAGAGTIGLALFILFSDWLGAVL